MKNKGGIQVKRIPLKGISFFILLAICTLALASGCGQAVRFTAEPVTETMTILTPSLVPEPISTPIPTIAPTRLPTLPTSQAEDLAMELYSSNGGCKLPCWWGITPGQTPGIVAKRFLETFAFEVSETRLSEESVLYYVPIPAPQEVYGTFFDKIT